MPWLVTLELVLLEEPEPELDEVFCDDMTDGVIYLLEVTLET